MNNKRSNQNNWVRQKRETLRDIGDIPRCDTKYLIIKKAYEQDLKGFLLFFHAEKFYRPFSKDQLKFIEDIESKILHGGTEAIGMPRGEGKTTIIIGACDWALSYGHRRYPAIIGASKPLADNIMNGIKTCFDSNDKKLAVFPEMCFPCYKLEGLSQRATGQLSNGEPTNILWKTDKVVFAQFTRDGMDEYLEKGMGSVVESRGMTSGVRGMQYTLKDGSVIRPDFVFLDDPQTRESAKSPTQCDERESLINSDIAGLSGIGKKLSMLCACTVICQDDLADRILEKWQSVRAKALYEFPNEHKKLWKEYIEKYRDWRKKGIEQDEGNKFYKKHRKKMDKGAVVGNEHRVNDGELSALQSIYNYISEYGEASFYSELQNQPRDNASQLYEINAQMILKRCNGYERTVIPEECNYINAGIDVNHYALSWAVSAVKGDLTGYGIDYGQYPKGKELWTPDSPMIAEDAIYQGVMNCSKELIKRHPHLKLIVIDGNYATDTIYRVVKQMKQSIPAVMFLVGRGVPSERYSEPDNKNLIINKGYECILRNSQRGEHIIFNSHYWHMHLQKAFFLEVGMKGSYSFWGEAGTDHRVIANHICADRLTDMEIKPTAKGGVEIYKWVKRPQDKNDLSDAVVMSLVGASIFGARADAREAPKVYKKKPRRRVSSISI